ncbi:MAG TPA: radical SAM protein [archaeon]|nr:radical SAM protein [archaeon]
MRIGYLYKFSKLAGRYLYDTGKRFLKKEKNYEAVTDSPPVSALIELTNRCNLRCEFCFNNEKMGHKGFMEFDTFRKAVDQIIELNPRMGNVGLHNRGESLLHPRIVDCVKYASDKGLNVNILSNGQLLTKDLSRKLIEAGLKQMRVSVDGADSQTYNKLRRGGDFDILVQNLKNFAEVNEELGSPCILKVKVTLQKDNYNQIDLFYKIFTPILGNSGMIILHLLNYWHGLVENDYFAKNKVLQIIKNLPGGESHTRKNTCKDLWKNVTISWDGSVKPCCRDVLDELDLGNINEVPLKTIWNSDKYVNLRSLHLKKDFSTIPVCANCYFDNPHFLHIFNQYYQSKYAYLGSKKNV